MIDGAGRGFRHWSATGKTLIPSSPTLKPGEEGYGDELNLIKRGAVVVSYRSSLNCSVGEIIEGLVADETRSTKRFEGRVNGLCLDFCWHLSQDLGWRRADKEQRRNGSLSRRRCRDGRFLTVVKLPRGKRFLPRIKIKPVRAAAGDAGLKGTARIKLLPPSSDLFKPSPPDRKSVV